MSAGQYQSRGFKAGHALCKLWGKPGFDGKLARVMNGDQIQNRFFRGALVEAVDLGLGVDESSGAQARLATLADLRRRIQLELFKIGF